MKSLVVILVFSLMSATQTIAQADIIIPGAKAIKTEHSPVPKEYKTKKLPKTYSDTSCLKEDTRFGTWFKLYPGSSQLRAVVSTGFTWGNLADPKIYLAVVDTSNRQSGLTLLGCSTFVGSKGDFTVEWMNVRPGKKHYLLVTGTDNKQQFALYLTEKFTSTTAANSKDREKTDAFELNLPDEAIVSSETQSDTKDANATAVVMGRIRSPNGSPKAGYPVVLLDDDLKVGRASTTDESGVFRIEGVNPDRINLIRMEEDDNKLLVDMFLYDADVNVLGKGQYIGHRLYSFQARPPIKPEFQVLSEKDMVVMVKKGKSSMTGKVVDRRTYLIGREGIRIGLYTTNKQLLRTAISDRNGLFLFTQLSDEDYIVKVDHNPGDDYVEIVLTDDMNMPYAVSNSSDQAADGYFRFRKLPKDQIEISTIEEVDISGIEHHYYNDLESEPIGARLELKTVHFAIGSYEISGESEELNHLVKELTDIVAIRIQIVGHTDNSGSARQNIKISQRRANAVKDYLVAKGIAATRIECDGKGDSEPLVPNDNALGRAQNRRVELVILSK